MATFRAYESVDMLDRRTSLGEVVYADRDLVAIEAFASTTLYLGDFRYPGDEVKGVIKSVLQYDFSDDLIFEIRGLRLDTKFLSAEVSATRAVRTAFADDDRIFGSSDSDRLSGFDGNDVIRGKGGADRILGQDGADTLYGGGGDDELKAGPGRDALYGDRGDDVLWGGGGRDLFHFGGRDGGDVIRDFADRRDKIALDGTPGRFRDLDLASNDRGDALIRFDATEIVLRGVGEDALGQGDFLFL